MKVRIVLAAPSLLAIFLSAACSGQHAGVVAPGNIGQPSTMSIAQPRTEAQASAMFQRSISPMNQPPGTAEYAVDAYYVSGDRRGALYPADVTIRHDSSGTYIVSPNGHTDKYPAGSKVTLLPHAMYLFVHPGDARPHVILTVYAHRLR